MSSSVMHFKPYKLDDVYKESAKELFMVVSTFAGGGGSSTGYKLAGGKVLLSNEFIPSAVETYLANYPDTPVSMMNIRKITKGKDRVIRWLSEYGIKKGEIDILDGSPPCSTFSTSGKGKKKIEQKNVKYSETTQDRIGMLIHDFVFLVKASQPKVFVIENVPNIKGADVFEHALSRLRRKNNYLVNYSVLNSSHFGVPQNRRRVFVVGIRSDIAKTAGIENEDHILELFPKGSSDQPATIKNAFEGLFIDDKERKALLSNCRRSSSFELIKTLPFNPSHKMKLCDLDKSWISDFNMVRSSWDHPVSTITQMGQQMGRGGIFHPSENRVFTVGELIRLTGLPDDFRLKGSFNQKAERIGRMVPPLLTMNLAKSIYEQVLKGFSYKKSFDHN